MTLPELIAALEKAAAEQQDALIDEAVQLAERQGWITTNARIKARRMLDAEAYESAALTLVLEGMRVGLMEWDVDILREEGPWQCIFIPTGGGDCIDSGQLARCDHARTPALALTIAALKARGDAA